MSRPVAFNKNNILIQAIEVFWKNGYHETTTQELVKATGLSKSSMYNTFSDKRGLFLEVLNTHIKNVQVFYTQALNQPSGVISNIEYVLRTMQQDNVVDKDFKGCFISNTAIELASHDKEIQQIIDENRLFIVNIITRSIAKGIEKGELSGSLDANSLGQFYYTLINGIKIDGKISRDPEIFEKTIQTGLLLLKIN
jgi:TetR/AcrR family transcriptional regulator, transcriptional repressor for nem operon